MHQRFCFHENFCFSFVKIKCLICDQRELVSKCPVYQEHSGQKAAVFMYERLGFLQCDRLKWVIKMEVGDLSVYLNCI